MSMLMAEDNPVHARLLVTRNAQREPTNQMDPSCLLCAMGRRLTDSAS
jgi:hypothetical protein